MPVHRQKKFTISNASDSTPVQPSPPMPNQQEFRLHLRALARGAIRIVLEAVMREELDALIGVGWGESSPKRKGYRNGYYQRDLVTTSGRLEDLNVPRDREGQFHTQIFERYRRYEPQVAQGLTEIFLAGASTRHPSGESPTPCWVWPPAPARSVASTRISSNNVKPGGSVHCKHIGVSSISMASISRCVMEIRWMGS